MYIVLACHTVCFPLHIGLKDRAAEISCAGGMTVRAWCNEQALVIDGSCGESFELVLAQSMYGNCQIIDHEQLETDGFDLSCPSSDDTESVDDRYT